VPCAYSYSLPAWAGGAAWIASATDLTRVMDALEPGAGAFLAPGSWGAVTTCALPGDDPTKGCYGLGLSLWQNGEVLEWGHEGGMYGVHTMAWRIGGGWTYAIVSNSDSTDFLYATWPAIEATIHGGFTGSATDLYPSFPSPDIPPYTGE
jgi:hypothetical protein